MERPLLIALLVGSSAAWATSAVASPQAAPAPRVGGASCESLVGLAVPETTITLAESRAATAFLPPGSRAPIAPTAPFCRVAGTIAPEVRFEVWMPSPVSWNGKFNGVGNGGLAGSISYSAMNAALARNYATASTDTGHQGGNGSWALGRPELLVDFASRGIHVTTIAARRIVQAYYGQAPRYSYFTGCSGGGGQALSEAQRYPLDYDGIVAGAPANHATRMWPGELWPVWYSHRSAASLIPSEKLPVLKRAVLAACDELDAVKDGLIQDPRKCRFDPATIQCEGAEGAECLTPAQVETVRATYGGLKDPTSGRSFWPGYEPGTELAWAFRLGSAGGPPNAYFKYFAMADQNWDWRTFDMSDPKNMQLMYDAEARLGAILNSTDPDLGSFEGAGGKLILYHGWSDQNISPRNSVAYYESVAAFHGGEQAAQGFLRLFMAPGMGHCGGGDGPNTFDALSALESWVEKGEAPASILATHAGPDGKVDRSRPLCVYPQVDTYEGSGDINDAASFRCAPPR